jgi:hydrogenase maturation protein HypF
VTALWDQAPPLAHLEEVTVVAVPVDTASGFAIRHSVARPGASLISPDVATCAECQRELHSPTDRRFRYAFTNCTNCGPRFTIIEGLPYDRPLTTMRVFPMCTDCQAEYENPLDRRFHAQPNACPVCGPRVWMSAGGADAAVDGHGYGDALASAEDPLKAAALLLRLGGTIAIKGIGGFHLSCDATNDEAVRWLRRRKGRPAKPFAVMMAGTEMVRHYCQLSAEEEELLCSPAAPIVLLWREPGTDLALTVSPRSHIVGVMLPYTPLHHVLLREVGRPLVMTSGNHIDQPLAQNNEDAVKELGDIADAFLFHNRRIHVRCDDSVWMAPLIAGGEARAFPVRRSRGYAPLPVKLHFRAEVPILGAGAQMKNVLCLLKRDQAFLSQHIGELDNLETLEFYRASTDHFQTIFRVAPKVVAHDLHPDYLSTRFAKEMAALDRQIELQPVQHHHAHVASCMADNRVSGPVIGVVLDGTGYGTDGRVWGGEFLVADYRGFERAGHLEYLPLPGGEAAIRRPYRIALGYLLALLGQVPDLPFLGEVGAEERRIVTQQVHKGLHTPVTSSCGRLFDAVAALIGVRGEVSYEAQAAVELEMVATEGGMAAPEKWLEKPYPFGIEQVDHAYLIRVEETLRAIVGDAGAQVPQAVISRRFHATVAAMIRQMCVRIRDDRDLWDVALSGGCFQNRLLLWLATSFLQEDGFRVIVHHRVPPNDGGIALGQVAVAAHRHTD